MSGLKLRGEFTWEVWSPEGKIVRLETITNGITVDGITDMFEQYLRQGTGITPYFGLIESVGYSSVSSLDTMAAHAGWTEVTDYNEATRPAWAPDVVASATATNSIKGLFTMTAAKDVKGLFITTESTKSGTTGKLWCTAIFDLVNSLQSGQVARAGYSLSGVGA